MALRTKLSRIATDPVCYMNVATADGSPFPGNADDSDDIGIHAMFGSRWSDIARTGLKSAENLWIYEVVLRSRIETRSAFARAVAKRQIFRTVTITFPSRTLADGDRGKCLAATAGSDTFTDAVFFWKHHCMTGLPFERYCFAATARESHKPRILEPLRANRPPAIPLDRWRRSLH